MFSLSGAVENFRRYLLIRTDILQKTVDGCPCLMFALRDYRREMAGDAKSDAPEAWSPKRVGGKEEKNGERETEDRGRINERFSFN